MGADLLGQVDPVLIDKLSQVGPWGAAVIIIMMLRKEIARVFSAPRDDRAVETLLTEMNHQFGVNMEMFRETNSDLSAIRATMGELLLVQRQVLLEMTRGKG